MELFKDNETNNETKWNMTQLKIPLVGGEQVGYFTSATVDLNSGLLRTKSS